MNIFNKFELEQTVYLKTDKDQEERIITGITIRKSSMVYELSQCTSTSWHYDFEITDKPDFLKTLKN